MQWEKSQNKRNAKGDPEAMAMRKTNELLEHSLTDIHADSLENRISVNDLAAAQRQKSLGTSATYSSQLEDHQKDKNKKSKNNEEIMNINQKQLDIELSNFRLTKPFKSVSIAADD